MDWFDRILKSEAAPAFWRRAALPTLAYWALGLLMAWQGRYLLTPDGFSYVQVARHYANGDWELAVNSWWSPMFSWLTVPFIWLKVQPILAMRLMNVAFGWGFALGVGAVTRFITGGGWFAGYVLGLLSALIMAPRYLTPIMVLMCVTVWYFLVTAKLLQTDSLKQFFKLGLLGGVAYLVKAYALPFFVVHILATVLMKTFFKGQVRLKYCLQEYAVAVAGLLLVAGPWIAVISWHDGQFTVSSAGRDASLWSTKQDYQSLPFKRLNFPRDGRIWCWEDPTEVPGLRPWSPFDGMDEFKKELRIVLRNIAAIPAKLNTIDHLGLMALGLVFSILCVFPLRTAMQTRRGRWQIWGLVSVAIYFSGYLATLVTDRYLWPTWAILLPLFVAGRAARGSAAEFAFSTLAAPNRWARLLDRFHPVFLLVFAAVLTLSAGNEIRLLFSPREEARYGAELMRIGQEENTRAALFAANKWRAGLYVSYWAKGRFIGELAGKTPEAIATELVSFGRPTLLIFGDKELAAALMSSPQFRLGKTRGDFFWEFELQSSGNG